MNGPVIVALVLFALTFLIGIVLIREMRMHGYWRSLVAASDQEAIRQLLAAEVDHWRTMRPPKGISAAVWAGVQNLEVQGGSATVVHVSTSAEAEFRLIQGRRVQAASALDTALATAARLLEMILYDIPDYRPAAVRLDVYTTFRDASGQPTPEPILYVYADRERAAGIDWDEPEPLALLEAFDLRFDLNAAEQPRPIPLPPPLLAPDSGAAPGTAPPPPE